MNESSGAGLLSFLLPSGNPFGDLLYFLSLSGIELRGHAGVRKGALTAVGLKPT